MTSQNALLPWNMYHTLLNEIFSSELKKYLPPLHFLSIYVSTCLQSIWFHSITEVSSLSFPSCKPLCRCLSELTDDPEQTPENGWLTPWDLYAPTVNNAVLLCRSTANTLEVKQPWLPAWSTERTRTELGLPDVDQHVGVGAVPHGQVVVVPPVVVLDRLLLRAPRHYIVIEFTPLRRKFHRKVILHVKTCSWMRN